ncbi:MAG: 30S ribosomal protein S18 [Tepidiformaceae bacterium]
MSNDERPPRDDRPPREDREGGGDRPQRPSGPRRFGSRRRVCRFCADHIPGVDYKDVGRLRMYISDRGKIEPRRKSGACQKHQRMVATAVKRARHLALLPYTLGHVRQTGVFPTRG